MPFYEPEEFPEEPEESEEPRRRCRHIFTAGRRCGSPCLRSEQFCYHHHTTRRPVEDPKARRARIGLLTLPEPEDRESVRAAVAQIMHAIAHNAIDLKRAGMLLYSLQIALCSFPPQPRPAPSKIPSNLIPLSDIPDDIVVDETHGVIAPEEEYEPPPELRPRRSLARRFLDEVERYEAQQAADAAAEDLIPSEVPGGAIDLNAAAEPEIPRQTPEAPQPAAQEVQPDLQPMKLFTNRKCNRLSRKCHSDRRLAHSLPNAVEASAASRNRLFPFSHSLRE